MLPHFIQHFFILSWEGANSVQAGLALGRRRVGDEGKGREAQIRNKMDKNHGTAYTFPGALSISGYQITRDGPRSWSCLYSLMLDPSAWKCIDYVR